MTNDDNMIALPVKSTAKPEPQALDLRAYAERLAISLGWHLFTANGAGANDAQVITQRPCATMAERQRVPSLWISQDWRKHKRVTVSGCWPSSDATNGVCAPNGLDGKVEATFSPDKEPSVVAKELGRRTLTMYLRLHAECMAKVAEWEQHRDDGDALARRIHDAVGIDWRARRDGSVRKDFYVMRADEDGTCAHVQVSGTTVALQMTGLTEAQALRILQIVREG